MEKRNVYSFLTGYETRLRNVIKSCDIDKLVTSGNLSRREDNFIFDIVLPSLHDYILEELKVDTNGQKIDNRWTVKDKLTRESIKQQKYPYFGIELSGVLSVIFDAKYYTENSGNAEAELAQGLYETVFRRGFSEGLSQNNELTKQNAKYACFVAYDSSKNKALVKAYQALPDEVRFFLWEKENIFSILIG